MGPSNWGHCPSCGGNKLREESEADLDGSELIILWSCSCDDCFFSYKFDEKMDILD